MTIEQISITNQVDWTINYLFNAGYTWEQVVPRVIRKHGQSAFDLWQHANEDKAGC
jgi:hypothetical protein